MWGKIVLVKLMQSFPAKIFLCTMFNRCIPPRPRQRTVKMHFCNTKIVLLANVACSAHSFSCFYCVVILSLLWSSYFSLQSIFPNFIFLLKYQILLLHPKLAIFCSGLDKLPMKNSFNTFLKLIIFCQRISIRKFFNCLFQTFLCLNCFLFYDYFCLKPWKSNLNLFKVYYSTFLGIFFLKKMLDIGFSQKIPFFKEKEEQDPTRRRRERHRGDDRR
jgi:hypothetical protein